MSDLDANDDLGPTRAEIIQGLINPMSGDYVNEGTQQKDCILWAGGKPHKLGSYSLCLPEDMQKQASKDIWAQIVVR